MLTNSSFYTINPEQRKMPDSLSERELELSHLKLQLMNCPKKNLQNFFVQLKERVQGSNTSKNRQKTLAVALELSMVANDDSSFFNADRKLLNVAIAKAFSPLLLQSELSRNTRYRGSTLLEKLIDSKVLKNLVSADLVLKKEAVLFYKSLIGLSLRADEGKATADETLVSQFEKAMFLKATLEGKADKNRATKAAVKADIYSLLNESLSAIKDEYITSHSREAYDAAVAAIVNEDIKSFAQSITAPTAPVKVEISDYSAEITGANRSELLVNAVKKVLVDKWSELGESKDSKKLTLLHNLIKSRAITKAKDSSEVESMLSRLCTLNTDDFRGGLKLSTGLSNSDIKARQAVVKALKADLDAAITNISGDRPFTLAVRNLALEHNMIVERTALTKEDRTRIALDSFKLGVADATQLKRLAIHLSPTELAQEVLGSSATAESLAENPAFKASYAQFLVQLDSLKTIILTKLEAMSGLGAAVKPATREQAIKKAVKELLGEFNADTHQYTYTGIEDCEDELIAFVKVNNSTFEDKLTPFVPSDAAITFSVVTSEAVDGIQEKYIYRTESKKEDRSIAEMRSEYGAFSVYVKNSDDVFEEIVLPETGSYNDVFYEFLAEKFDGKMPAVDDVRIKLIEPTARSVDVIAEPVGLTSDLASLFLKVGRSYTKEIVRFRLENGTTIDVNRVTRVISVSEIDAATGNYGAPQDKPFPEMRNLKTLSVKDVFDKLERPVSFDQVATSGIHLIQNTEEAALLNKRLLVINPGDTGLGRKVMALSENLTKAELETKIRAEIGLGCTVNIVYNNPPVNDYDDAVSHFITNDVRPVITLTKDGDRVVQPAIELELSNSIGTFSGSSVLEDCKVEDLAKQVSMTLGRDAVDDAGKKVKITYASPDDATVTEEEEITVIDATSLSAKLLNFRATDPAKANYVISKIAVETASFENSALVTTESGLESRVSFKGLGLSFDDGTDLLYRHSSFADAPDVGLFLLAFIEQKSSELKVFESQISIDVFDKNNNKLNDETALLSAVDKPLRVTYTVSDFEIDVYESGNVKSRTLNPQETVRTLLSGTDAKAMKILFKNTSGEIVDYYCLPGSSNFDKPFYEVSESILGPDEHITQVRFLSSEDLRFSTKLATVDRSRVAAKQSCIGGGSALTLIDTTNAENSVGVGLPEDMTFETKADLHSYLFTGAQAKDYEYGDTVPVHFRAASVATDTVKLTVDDTTTFQQLAIRAISQAHSTSSETGGTHTVAVKGTSKQFSAAAGTPFNTLMSNFIFGESSLDTSLPFEATNIDTGTGTGIEIPRFNNSRGIKTLAQFIAHLRSKSGLENIGLVVDAAGFDCTKVISADQLTAADNRILLNTLTIKKVFLSSAPIDSEIQTFSAEVTGSDSEQSEKTARKQVIFGDLANKELVMVRKPAAGADDVAQLTAYSTFEDFDRSLAIEGVHGLFLKDTGSALPTPAELKVLRRANAAILTYENCTAVATQTIVSDDANNDILDIVVSTQANPSVAVNEALSGKKLAFVTKEDGRYKSTVYDVAHAGESLDRNDFVQIAIVEDTAVSADDVAVTKEADYSGFQNKLETYRYYDLELPVYLPKRSSVDELNYKYLALFNVTVSDLSDESSLRLYDSIITKFEKAITAENIAKIVRDLIRTGYKVETDSIVDRLFSEVKKELSAKDQLLINNDNMRYLLSYLLKNTFTQGAIDTILKRNLVNAFLEINILPEADRGEKAYKLGSILRLDVNRDNALETIECELLPVVLSELKIKFDLAVQTAYKKLALPLRAGNKHEINKVIEFIETEELTHYQTLLFLLAENSQLPSEFSESLHLASNVTADLYDEQAVANLQKTYLGLSKAERTSFMSEIYAVYTNAAEVKAKLLDGLNQFDISDFDMSLKSSHDKVLMAYLENNELELGGNEATIASHFEQLTGIYVSPETSRAYVSYFSLELSQLIYELLTRSVISASNSDDLYAAILNKKDIVLKAFIEKTGVDTKSKIYVEMLSQLLASSDNKLSVLGKTFELSSIKEFLPTILDRVSSDEAAIKRPSESSLYARSVELQSQLESLNQHVSYLRDVQSDLAQMKADYTRKAEFLKISVETKARLEYQARVAQFNSVKSTINAFLRSQYSFSSLRSDISDTVADLASRAAQEYILTGSVKDELFNQIGVTNAVTKTNLQTRLVTQLNEQNTAFEPALNGLTVTALNFYQTPRLTLANVLDSITVPAGKTLAYQLDDIKEGAAATLVNKSDRTAFDASQLGLELVLTGVKFYDTATEPFLAVSNLDEDTQTGLKEILTYNEASREFDMNPLVCPNTAAKDDYEYVYAKLRDVSMLLTDITDVEVENSFDTLDGTIETEADIAVQIDRLDRSILATQERLAALDEELSGAKSTVLVSGRENKSAAIFRAYGSYLNAVRSGAIFSKDLDSVSEPVMLGKWKIDAAIQRSFTSLPLEISSLSSETGDSISTFIPTLLASSGYVLKFNIGTDAAPNFIAVNTLAVDAKITKNASNELFVYVDGEERKIEACSMFHGDTAVHDNLLTSAFGAFNQGSVTVAAFLKPENIVLKTIYEQLLNSKALLIAVKGEPGLKQLNVNQVDTQVRKSSKGSFELSEDNGETWAEIKAFKIRSKAERKLTFDGSNYDTRDDAVKTKLKLSKLLERKSVTELRLRDVLAHYKTLAGNREYTDYFVSLKVGTTEYSDPNILVKLEGGQLSIQKPGDAGLTIISEAVSIAFYRDSILHPKTTLSLTESLAVIDEYNDASVARSGLPTVSVVDFIEDEDTELATKFISHIQSRANQLQFNASVYVVLADTQVSQEEDSRSRTVSFTPRHVKLEALRYEDLPKVKLVYLSAVEDTDIATKMSKERFDALVNTSEIKFGSRVVDYKNTSLDPAVNTGYSSLALPQLSRASWLTKDRFYSVPVPGVFSRSIESIKQSTAVRAELGSLIKQIGQELPVKMSGIVDATSILKFKEAILKNDHLDSKKKLVSSTFSLAERKHADSASFSEDISTKSEAAKSEIVNKLINSGEKLAVTVSGRTEKTVIVHGESVGEIAQIREQRSSVPAMQIPLLQELLARGVELTVTDSLEVLRAEFIKLKTADDKLKTDSTDNRKFASLILDEATDTSQTVKLKLLKALILNAGYNLDLSTLPTYDDLVEVLTAKPADATAPKDVPFYDFLDTASDCFKKPVQKAGEQEADYIKRLNAEFTKRKALLKQLSLVSLKAALKTEAETLVDNFVEAEELPLFEYALADLTDARQCDAELVAKQKEMDEALRKKLNRLDDVAVKYLTDIEVYKNDLAKQGISITFDFPDQPNLSSDNLETKVEHMMDYLNNLKRKTVTFQKDSFIDKAEDEALHVLKDKLSSLSRKKDRLKENAVEKAMQAVLPKLISLRTKSSDEKTVWVESIRSQNNLLAEDFSKTVRDLLTQNSQSEAVDMVNKLYPDGEYSDSLIEVLSTYVDELDEVPSAIVAGTAQAKAEWLFKSTADKLDSSYKKWFFQRHPLITTAALIGTAAVTYLGYSFYQAYQEELTADPNGSISDLSQVAAEKVGTAIYNGVNATYNSLPSIDEAQSFLAGLPSQISSTVSSGVQNAWNALSNVSWWNTTEPITDPVSSIPEKLPTLQPTLLPDVGARNMFWDRVWSNVTTA